VKLAPAHVDVWLAFDRDIPETHVGPQLTALLAPDELERAGRLRSAVLRHQFRVTRILQRTVLSAYAAEVAPADWRFVSGAHGKPELAQPFAALGIHFNVAHSAGLVALAVARDAAVGIDVENTRARAAPLAVAARYFSADEARDLQALPAGEQALRFYSLWTLKESWLKATGRGLAAGLRNVSFVLDDRHAAVRVALANDVTAHWHFWQAQPGAEHVLALALHSEQGGEFGVRMQRWSHATPHAPEPLAAPRALGTAAAGSGQEQRAQA
jgi:4'-phosphopantetheinyl transferase